MHFRSTHRIFLLNGEHAFYLSEMLILIVQNWDLRATSGIFHQRKEAANNWMEEVNVAHIK